MRREDEKTGFRLSALSSQNPVFGCRCSALRKNGGPSRVLLLSARS